MPVIEVLSSIKDSEFQVIIKFTLAKQLFIEEFDLAQLQLALTRISL